jgi:arylsulfatase A-like enzyme
MKRIKLLLAALIIPLLFSACGTKESKTAEKRPNFIFFILDDMEKNMFNCLPEGKGKNLTPNIDRLAAEGTLMMNQYVASPVCTPSRFNSLTGVYGSRANNEEFKKEAEKNGQSIVQWNTDIIPGDENTLPKILQRNGYRTGFVGKNHVMKVKGWTWLPFATDVTKPEVKEILAENKKLVREGFKKMGWSFVESVYYRNPEMLGPEVLSVHNQDWITKGAIDFFDTQKKDEPFFLYFATTIPHWPTEPKRSWNANPLATADGFLDDTLHVQPPRHTIPERLEKAGLGGNDKENVLWLDDAIGAVMKKLEERGLLDNTYVFFFSDHGQDAKGTLYQGGVLDPSIIWHFGGLKSGKVNYTKISNIDFAPTMLDLAGIDWKKYNFDGKSFKSVLDGNPDEVHKSLYFEMGYTRAIIKGKYKYLALRYPDYALKWTMAERKARVDSINAKRKKRNQILANPTADPTLPFSHITLLPGGNNAELSSTGKLPGYYDPDQLYDLEKDPGELHNLAYDPKYKDVLEDMKAEMKKYLSTFKYGFPLDRHDVSQLELLKKYKK